MTSARERILGQVRESLGRREGDGSAERAAARIAARAPNLVPARAQVPAAEQVELFLRLAAEVQVSHERVASPADVPVALARYLASHNLPTRVRRAPDPALDALPWASQPLLEVQAGKAEPDDAVSVTGAFAAIAETGTLMLLSGRDSPTTLNFLPETHVVVLRRSQVIGTLEDAWTKLRAHGEMPRTVNFITGPSRTGDIAQTLYVGAHGPRSLHVILIED
ncbi:MAG: lactate utilization protein C [Alphaproteobacteria bacterium]|nr:lactate utilization protein C [Alphaproteobacteria bacterium]